MRAIVVTLLACLATTGVTACGGGGGGGTGAGSSTGPTFTLLFFDEFGTFPSSKWTTSGNGSATHDPARGFPTLGSLKLSGDVTVSAFTSAFPVGGGLQVFVRVHIPNDSVAPPSAFTSVSAISIISTESGTESAKLRIWRAGCGTTTFATRFDYSMGGGPFGETLFWEELNCASSPDGQFVNFAFIVHPDGSSEWRRDGNTMLSWNQDFGDGAVRLSLAGSPDAAGLPGFDFWFDDVAVFQMN